MLSPLTEKNLWELDYVNNNPAAFKDAYFEFASAHVYT